MKRLAFTLAIAVALPAAAATVGQSAPDFTAPDLQGKSVKLSDYRGKFVVLEWTNPECPYVQRHYESGNMQALHKEFASKDVVWLAVNTSRATSGDLAQWQAQKGAAPKATLADKGGAIARLYQARTTPHMYVIDPKGQLIYAGAIDDKRWASVADTKAAHNHVRAALDDAMAGKAVRVASTSPYGCAVKY